jgi:oxidase EvaA
MTTKFNELAFDSMLANFSVNSDAEILSWVNAVRESSSVEIEFIRFSELSDWKFNNRKSSLVHKTGKFFSINGVEITFEGSDEKVWRQPIINQPEFGFLGLISKCFNGVLHFLLQAKIEPGNLGRVQLSPTLQATRSNYMRVHQGRAPDYLDYFLRPGQDSVVVDQLQSEQGSRFLRKRNRNIILYLGEDVEIEVKSQFMWVSLKQVKRLMRIPNFINMDTRSVISSLRLSPGGLERASQVFRTSPIGEVSQAFFESSFCVDEGLFSYESAVAFLAEQRFQRRAYTVVCNLTEMDDWQVLEDGISNAKNRHFKIAPANILISGREVNSWNQPIVVPVEPGICALVGLKIGGVLHFAIQAKREGGLVDSVEYAPSVQCLPSNYLIDGKSSLPFLDLILGEKIKVVYDTFQSEEGGRFYHEENRNLIVILDEHYGLELPKNFIWLTLGQLQRMLRYGGYINVQLRSLLAAVSFCDTDYGS